MNIDLSALGLNPEDIREMVIDKIVEQFFYTTVHNEDGDPVLVVTEFKSQVQKLIVAKVEDHVTNLMAPILDKAVTEHLKDFKIAQTNSYGEAKREPETITEYMVRRIDQFMRERVDTHGNSAEDYKINGKSVPYDNRYNEIRINKLIHFRMQDEIDQAMKATLQGANEHIMSALRAAVLDSLKQLNAKLNPTPKA